MKKVLLVLLAVSAQTAFGQTSPVPSQLSSPRGQLYFYYSNAKLYEAQGLYTQGIAELKKALTLEPENSFLFSSIANMYYNNRRAQEAAEYAEKSVKADPNNPDPHELLSRIYFDIYRDAVRNQARSSVQERAAALDRTVHEFEELVRIDPTNQPAALTLGGLYRQQGATEKAEALFRKVLGTQPDSEIAVKALAQFQIEGENFKAAIEILEEFLVKRPDSEECWELLGDAYSSIDRFDKAADAYKRAGDLVPGQRDLQYAYAQALITDTQYEEAGKVYQKLYREDPTDLSSLVLLSEAYRHQMRFDEARASLQRAADLVPNNLQIELGLASVDRDDARFDNALKRLTDMLRRTERANGSYSEPERQNRRRIITQAASILSTMGRHDDAIRSFMDLRALTPNEKGRIDAMIVDTHRDAGNLDKALEYADNAVKDSPANRALLITRADILAEKGQLDEAIQVLEKLPAVNGNDRDIDVVAAKAGIYERAQKFGDAQRVLDGAIQRFPEEMQVHFLQGALFEKQDRVGEAETAFRKALDLDRNNPAVLNYLGYMLADRNTRLDEALKLIGKAVEVDPGNGAYLDSLGWVYFRMKRMDLAERYLTKAALFVHHDADIHDHLGEFYFQTGAYENAKAAWSKALQFSTGDADIQRFQKKLAELKSKTVDK